MLEKSSRLLGLLAVDQQHRHHLPILRWFVDLLPWSFHDQRLQYRLRQETASTIAARSPGRPAVISPSTRAATSRRSATRTLQLRPAELPPVSRRSAIPPARPGTIRSTRTSTSIRARCSCMTLEPGADRGFGRLLRRCVLDQLRHRRQRQPAADRVWNRRTSAKTSSASRCPAARSCRWNSVAGRGRRGSRQRHRALRLPLRDRLAVEITDGWNGWTCLLSTVTWTCRSRSSATSRSPRPTTPSTAISNGYRRGGVRERDRPRRGLRAVEHLQQFGLPGRRHRSPAEVPGDDCGLQTATPANRSPAPTSPATSASTASSRPGPRTAWASASAPSIVVNRWRPRLTAPSPRATWPVSAARRSPPLALST